MERKLAVILAVDVVGYSAHMESDEAGTFQRLRAGRKELFEPEIAKHQGRVFKLMGDGLLAEFGSVVNAVECAVVLQRGMAERNASVDHDKRLEVRVGINLGEVIVEGDDRYGEGVNVASRLQQLAEPGGICVSGKVSREVERKLAFAFEPMGEHRVKNIAEPIPCYRVNLQSASAPPGPSTASQPRAERMSLAVLPFTNMSSDPEQEFFVDGLAEDLITDLSKVPGLTVIARNSSFAYKGKSTDIRGIGRDLGVRYIIEGSVRRAVSRVRINVQLIEAADGAHLWADRFDRDLADVFMLQDEVVGRIVGALSDALPSARAVPTRRATNLEAYDLFARGRVLVAQSVESNRAARPLLEKAIALDPGFADAHAWLAMSHHFSWAYWGEPKQDHQEAALAAAKRAVALDPDNAVGHTMMAYILNNNDRLEEGEAALATALRIDPNHADAWMFLGELKTQQGDAEQGVSCIKKAFELNPHPPGFYYWILGYAQYAAGEYEEVVRALRNEATYRTGSQRILAAALAQLGRIEEAKAEGAQFLAANPHFSAHQWAITQPLQRESDRRNFVDGYVKAGLPA